MTALVQGRRACWFRYGWPWRRLFPHLTTSDVADQRSYAAEIPQVSECHGTTGEDCFYLKVYLRSIDELSRLLDRFLAHGETTTSIINASPIPRRAPPLSSL
jgi:DNA-binding Lrp family transcriptional regulator